MQQAMFYILGGLAVLSAIGVVALRHPIHSAFSLIATLFFLAGVFVLLDAHFVAAIQVLVYAGAVMVLFTFVIMLLNLSTDEIGPANVTVSKFLGLAALAVIAYAIFTGFKGSVAGTSGEIGGEFGTVGQIGKLLFTKYLFPFEIVSVLLIAAVIGAVILAKKRL